MKKVQEEKSFNFWSPIHWLFFACSMGTALYDLSCVCSFCIVFCQEKKSAMSMKWRERVICGGRFGEKRELIFCCRPNGLHLHPPFPVGYRMGEHLHPIHRGKKEQEGGEGSVHSGSASWRGEGGAVAKYYKGVIKRCYLSYLTLQWGVSYTVKKGYRFSVTRRDVT